LISFPKHIANKSFVWSIQTIESIDHSYTGILEYHCSITVSRIWLIGWFFSRAQTWLLGVSICLTTLSSKSNTLWISSLDHDLMIHDSSESVNISLISSSVWLSFSLIFLSHSTALTTRKAWLRVQINGWNTV
jgi:hypothetical protein